MIQAGQTWKHKKKIVTVERVDETPNGTFIYTSDGVAYGKKTFLSVYTLIEE